VRLNIVLEDNPPARAPLCILGGKLEDTHGKKRGFLIGLAHLGADQRVSPGLLLLIAAARR